jgi:hypothetical protein
MPRFRPARFLATMSLALSAVLVVAVSDMPAAHADTPINGYFTYTLQNQNDGLCLEIDNWSTGDGSRATQNACDGGANQEWLIFAYAPGEQIRNVYTGKCLGISYGSNANFATAVQNPCDTSSSQFWQPKYVPGCGCIATWVNGLSGKCLDVKDWNRNGDATIQQYDCHGGANQLWVENAHFHSNPPPPSPPRTGPIALCPKILCP